MKTSQQTNELTRRSFLKTSGAAVAALSVADFSYAAAKTETLAVAGGAKAVTFPAKQFAALTRWPRYGDAEKQALCALLDNNKFYDELPAFEKEWKAYTQSSFVKAHVNGTSALTSMYFALDLPPGSEIMVPSYTFFATCLAMRFFGCVPIFIDIDPKTACFDLEDAKRKLTPRTKAVVAMHSWGLPCEMDRIADWAKEKGLILLEDAAHAHGASMQGKKMGTWGAMGIYSFQASKVMPTVEGGMGMYQTREYFERAAAFGHYEDPVKFDKASPVRAYEGTGFGQKYRMHPFAAAVARQQLKRLDDINALVEKNVKAMNQHLVQLEGVTEPRLRADQKRVCYSGNLLFVDFKKAGLSRPALIKALQGEGVAAKFWDYPEQHKLKIYSEAKWWHHPPQVPASMPGNEYVNANHIFVPAIYGEAPELIDQYVQAFQKVWAHRAALAKL
ncbi:MAG: DegT/DnrJ/EryC1/StrS family aminotransferase [Verrucomicrobia bacterium]|nr:DegT/DnrJ/EryC1/StrS family aminotransferase [Verrucomicrobiota bacterium]